MIHAGKRAVALVLALALAGCAPTPTARLPVYRCWPKGRVQVADAVMQCLAADPARGRVMEFDLAPWLSRL